MSEAGLSGPEGVIGRHRRGGVQEQAGTRISGQHGIHLPVRARGRTAPMAASRAGNARQGFRNWKPAIMRMASTMAASCIAKVHQACPMRQKLANGHGSTWTSALRPTVSQRRKDSIEVSSSTATRGHDWPAAACPAPCLSAQAAGGWPCLRVEMVQSTRSAYGLGPQLYWQPAAVHEGRQHLGGGREQNDGQLFPLALLEVELIASLPPKISG